VKPRKGVLTTPNRNHTRRNSTAALWATYMRLSAHQDSADARAAILRIGKALQGHRQGQEDLVRVETAVQDMADVVHWLSGALGAKKLP
jgi:hypothetical protein